MKCTICALAAMLTLGLAGLSNSALAGCGACAKGGQEKPHVHKDAAKCGAECKQADCTGCKKAKKACAEGCTKPCCAKKDKKAA